MMMMMMMLRWLLPWWWWRWRRPSLGPLVSMGAPRVLIWYISIIPLLYLWVFAYFGLFCCFLFSCSVGVLIHPCDLVACFAAYTCGSCSLLAFLRGSNRARFPGTPWGNNDKRNEQQQFWQECKKERERERTKKKRDRGRLKNCQLYNTNSLYQGSLRFLHTVSCSLFHDNASSH